MPTVLDREPGKRARADLVRRVLGIGGGHKNQCGLAGNNLVPFATSRPESPLRQRDEDQMTTTFPTFADIAAAEEKIRNVITPTPLLHSKTLSQITGCELWLKFENLQFTASFKERGALNKLLTLTEVERSKGVCAMSAGNHAQGVAYHAMRLGIPATIIMPKTTPRTKITRTREHGAAVVIAGDNLSEALATALDVATEHELTFLHPYDDPAVIAGQGTIGLELFGWPNSLPEQAPFDTLLVPVGGGGLISGIATVARALFPDIAILGVQTESFPSMAAALAGDDTPCSDKLTIAEGIAVKSAGRLTREIVREHVDEIINVSEMTIEQSIALLLSVEKTVVEGAGAVGLAAILENRERFEGRRIATILSGGNIDLSALASVAMRELVRTNRLCQFKVDVPDAPGSLADVAATLHDAGANIVSIDHDRLSIVHNARASLLTVEIEVDGPEQGERAVKALVDKGYAAHRFGSDLTA